MKNKWVRTNRSQDDVVSNTNKLLEFLKYQDINVVYLDRLSNYQNQFSEGGFIRITARRPGERDISFSVTIENRAESCCVFTEKDKYNVGIYD